GLVYARMRDKIQVGILGIQSTGTDVKAVQPKVKRILQSIVVVDKSPVVYDHAVYRIVLHYILFDDVLSIGYQQPKGIAVVNLGCDGVRCGRRVGRIAKQPRKVVAVGIEFKLYKGAVHFKYTEVVDRACGV